MRIVVDLDDTVADLFTPWLAWYNFAYGDHLTPEDVLTYAIHNHVKPACGAHIYDYFNAAGCYDRVLPFVGAVEALQRLHCAGHDVVIATALCGDLHTSAVEKNQVDKALDAFSTAQQSGVGWSQGFVQGGCFP